MADWRTLCKAPDLEVNDRGVLVLLFADRRQQVRVVEEEKYYLLRSTVATASRHPGDEAFRLRVWYMNRGMVLTGLRFDERDRLVAESRVPKTGLSKAEFLFHIQRLAREADRLEYILTGEDRE